MSLRFEFVKFALADDSNIAELCRRFQVRCQKQGIIFVADPLKRNPLPLKHLFQALRFNFQPIDPEMDRKRLT